MIKFLVPGILISIALISLVMHYQHFSKDLMSAHVWRQAQTQTTINNFYEEDMNILNPRRNDRGNGEGIFRMEFPLMQWLVACTYKLFGNHLLLTRVFMFIIGLFSVLGMYKLLAAIFQNNKIALIGAWAFNFSPSFYYYTITPIPDNLALCCSLWGIALFFTWYRKRKTHILLFSGLLLSIGALCKLPFILYFIIPLIYFLTKIVRSGIRKDLLFKPFLILVWLVLPLAWYFSVIPDWQGNDVVNGILENTIPLHVLLYYLRSNLISTIPELLLNYGSVLFFLSGFCFLIINKSFKHALFPVLCIWSFALLSYFLFEINVIGYSHDYYLFPFYPILFMLVGYGAYHLFELKRAAVRILVVLLLLILPFTANLRMLHRWNPDSPGFNKDLLTYKKELRAAAPKDALCIAGNDDSHFIFFYYINKKGWGFDSDNLNANDIRNMIEHGASYLYSDSRNIDSSEELKQMLGNPTLEMGSVRVYKLNKD